ncbi:DUF805 domain-containing protein [Rhodobacteraceae bacterium RKSG542]|uniref:DUF805 domain-containing protein n=1 Tax=Pseudovibrio flavus TaxID=2529854 RepID=UPI0012BC27B0|nr:DUF805 domain-containing protein [Pseudovibrio flavus]MTI17196.1 DUF805 domain-containing protein [Pseudovibrio flavus]
MPKSPRPQLGFLWLFLSPFGRLSRQPFWLAMGLMWCIMFIAFNVTAGQVLSSIDPNTATPITIDHFISQNSLLPFMIPATKVFELALVIKRLQDRGWNGFLALFTFLPLLNFLFIFFVGIQPSEKGPNKYGPTPDSKYTRTRNK